MKKQIISVIKFCIFFFIGFFLLWLVFRKVDLNQVIRQIISANYWWIVVSLFFAVISHLARAIRWNILINSMGHKTQTSTTFYAVMIGYFANMALPRLGEVSRCGVLSKKNKVPFDSLLGSVVAERVFDLLVLILLLILVVLFQVEVLGGFVNKFIIVPIYAKFSNHSFSILLIIFACVLLLTLLHIIYRAYKSKILQLPVFLKIQNFFVGFMDGVSTIRKLEKKGAFLFYTFLIWFMYFLMTYVVFFAMSETSNLTAFDGLTVLAIGSIGMVIPVPGGIGAYHFIVKAVLYELYHIPNDIAASWATLIHTSQSLLIVVLGSVSYLLIISIAKKRSYAQI